MKGEGQPRKGNGGWGMAKYDLTLVPTQTLTVAKVVPDAPLVFVMFVVNGDSTGLSGADNLWKACQSLSECSTESLRPLRACLRSWESSDRPWEGSNRPWMSSERAQTGSRGLRQALEASDRP